MISNSKLKPCPFCGDSVNIMYNSALNVFYVYHNNEECKFNEFEIDGYYAKSLSDAYKIWNTRSTN
jgi:ssDNA-binding Zn-finger/Zn-ribbon topoisomerase 1